MQDTEVLIIGGSLVGLSAAVFLAWRGVSATVIEKHAGSSPHPRAVGYTEHTLEFFRAVGLGDRIPQVPPGTRLRRARVESLSGEWKDETPWTPGALAEAWSGTSSPCTGAAIAQDVLEPLLRQRARELGADLRPGVEMLSFAQDGEGVSVRVRERVSGREYGLRARYLVAADGADSAIREQLGIARRGVGHLRTLRSVLFRCAEADAWLDRGIRQFEIEQPELQAFLTTYGDGRWVLMFDDDRERSDVELHAAVTRALGRPMAFEILATGRWDMAGRIAERYSRGRIFLAGDAAHQLPPTRGGFGANTGIDDAYNLAWKLQMVLRHGASPALLDTYDDERRPIGWLRHQQTFARPDHARWIGNRLHDEALYSSTAMELGQLMRSTSVIGAAPGLPPAAEPETWAGQPGVRAPHVWIRKGEQVLSTVDLFTRRFTLITADAGWAHAARQVGDGLPMALDVVLVGEDVVFPSEAPFEHHFGVAPSGCSLVRPDGVVAWRSEGMQDDPHACLRDVLARVAALPS
ncbi:MAG: FAD-dependent monooxygenase [Pseudoxanthomonas sp.]|nr:FAD-dependent monooxygenase [Pseudoxanthomonas sp.]